MSGALSVLPCSQCKDTSILFQEYSGQHLCGKHLASSIRKRVAKEIRSQINLPKNARHPDGSPFRIFVAISGGKDSAVLLSMLVDIIGRRRDVEIISGCIDEGIDGYRSPSLELARELAESLNIQFETLSYEDIGYDRMDNVVKKMPIIGENNPDAKGMMPCSYCGVFRRQGINALAQKVNADIMALGHNLDDMAQSIIMNFQKGNIERSVRLAPHTDAP
ncbi:MAG: tRNA 2-thiocytidine biosynthesis protein TtcA, partial [Euryarchaeota archaeon]|nr:tRNA 2-thiocytidine biosynthesis protein TtcA [Euryarchaeota archaeon]